MRGFAILSACTFFVSIADIITEAALATAAPASTTAASTKSEVTALPVVSLSSSEAAGPIGILHSIYNEVFDIQDDDAAADEAFTPYKSANLTGWFGPKACDSFGSKCTKCIKNGGCSYCATTKKCMDADKATASCKKITTSKWKCSDHMRWWGLFLILFCCICLCPLISFICFICVIKKLCCPKDNEADD